MAPVIHKCEGKCPRGYVCVCRKKQKKRKKKAEKQIVAGAAVKVSGVPRAVPTSLLLERQGVGRLIKNARTAGLEINQGAYDAYNEAFERRAAAARYGIPSAAHTAGVRSRQALRNMVRPRVPRERSVQIRADPDIMASAAEARNSSTPLPRVEPGEFQATPAADVVIKKEKSTPFFERISLPLRGRRRNAVLPTPGGSLPEGIQAIREEQSSSSAPEYTDVDQLPIVGTPYRPPPDLDIDVSGAQSALRRMSDRIDAELLPDPVTPERLSTIIEKTPMGGVRTLFM